jgi:assimilatory nitrate reductase catalytic subunit
MYHTTETAQRADLVLPAAGWGEKEGTLINSERRIGCIKKVARPPGLALADFAIFQAVAHYWGCGEMFAAWRSPADVFQILKRLSRDQPCDVTGIEDYRMIDERGGIQWPFPAGADDRGERRLFENGRFFHPDGKARFIFEAPRPLPELPNRKYPLLLLTGRGTAAQWHTQTRTSKSTVLRKISREHIYAEVNPLDAERCRIGNDDWITVESQRGRVRARAFLTHAVQPGHIFIPMHYEITNQLTHAAFDPYSRQPAYKACAVRIEKCAR